MIPLIMWSLKKNDTNDLIYKTETDSQTQSKNFWLPGRGRKVREFGVDMSPCYV